VRSANVRIALTLAVEGARAACVAAQDLPQRDYQLAATCARRFFLRLTANCFVFFANA
jgi:hypothetical protein